ncbi:MAG: SDR family oxidoreductase, partial [Ginsengibacter sp.]
MNIVVTGSSKGIGKAIAEKFSGLGNQVFITARNEDELSKTANIITEKNGGIVIKFFAADLSDKNETTKFAGWLLNQIDTIDILINNTGQFLPGSVYNEE